MDSADLTVFLPLLSAVVGAFIGAAATGLVRYVEDKRTRRRERDALLLLIDAEVYDHIRLLKRVREAAQELESVGFQNTAHELPPFSTIDWDGSKQRLAQLLASEHMGALILYYMALNTALANASPALVEDQPIQVRLNVRTHVLNDVAENLILLANNIRGVCNHLVGSVPDYPEIEATSEQSTLH